MAAGGPVAGGARLPKDARLAAGNLRRGWRSVGGAEDGREYRRIRRGWCYGEEAFRKELLGQMVGRAGENHYAEERQESDAEKARRIVAAELKRLNWTESELRRRRKGDPKKVRIARRLREKTTMTLKWIAGELYRAPGRGKEAELLFAPKSAACAAAVAHGFP